MMLKKRSKTSFMVMLILGFISAALAGVSSSNLNVFNTDFNDKVPGSFLGEGGAAFGEPVDLSSLTAEVIEETPGENFLMVENDSGNTNERSLRWQFFNNAEIIEGVVTFSFQFTPSTLDRYSIGVSESGGSSRSFLTLTYATDGTFSGTDAAGLITMANNSYAAGVTQNFKITYDMNAGTSELIINGAVVFTGREHGINDRGVGRLLTGYSSSNNNTPFTLDNMSVIAQVELALVLDADFEDKTLGQPIGTGGAAVGEPVTISNGLITEIIEDGLDNQALLLENTNGNALLLSWEYLNNTDFTSGTVTIELDVEFDALDQYRISFVKICPSATPYTSVTFAATGSIGVTDSDGFAGFVGSYQANQRYRLKLTYDMDAGLYNVLLDDDALLEDRAHEFNIGSGIGQIQTGFQSTALINSSYVIDNLQVRTNMLLSDEIFSNDFE